MILCSSCGYYTYTNDEDFPPTPYCNHHHRIIEHISECHNYTPKPWSNTSYPEIYQCKNKQPHHRKTNRQQWRP